MTVQGFAIRGFARLLAPFLAPRLALLLVLGASVGLVGFAPRPAAAEAVKIVALGDSLTAGLGLPAGDAFPAKLEQALAKQGITATISNAGVSGDTTTGGLARLDWSVPDGTQAVIVELGANDALRGIDPKITRDALDGILRKLHDRGIPVLLCGMLAPRNLGADYGKAFDPIFTELAGRYDALFYPFFLDGVFGDQALFQRDGLHPTASGVDEIVTRMLPKVKELVAKAKTAAKTARPS